jgi:hypothetical protein
MTSIDQSALDEITGYVRAGIDLLDEKGPAGWRNLINWDIVDMGHGQRCILGQVYGDYIIGMDDLGLSVYSISLPATRHGFSHFESATLAHVWHSMITECEN